MGKARAYRSGSRLGPAGSESANTWSEAGLHPAAPLETSHGVPSAVPPTACCTAVDSMPGPIFYFLSMPHASTQPASARPLARVEGAAPAQLPEGSARDGLLPTNAWPMPTKRRCQLGSDTDEFSEQLGANRHSTVRRPRSPVPPAVACRR